MKQFVPKNKGPAVVQSTSSNVLSDQYRDTLTISYQYLNNMPADIHFTFGEKTFATPVMAGPVGGIDKGEEGVLGYARGIQEAGSVFWMHFHDPVTWDAVLAEGIPAVRVIKPLKDNDAVLECIRHDTSLGAVAYAMDIDHGITVYGEYDHQAGRDFASKTTEDLRLFAQASPLPFIVKGVLSVQDALTAKEAGVSGIVISGHNNRFPCAVPPLKMLPKIREAVGQEMMILVDGGMNTGYDVFKALALGADGVLNAKGLMGAYLKDGREGVTDKLLQISAELKGAMSNTGSVDLQHINRNALILPDGI